MRGLRLALALFVAAVLGLPVAAAWADDPSWMVSTTGARAETTQQGGWDGYLDYRIRDTLTDGHCADMYVQSPAGSGWSHIKRWCSGAWGYFRAVMPELPIDLLVCRSGVGPCSASVQVWP